MTYSISQAAERFGIEPHTLRFYEKEGLVAPERTPSGVRVYTEENMARLETAMCLKGTGMPLKAIKQYFDLVDQGDATLDQRLEIFTQHREHVLRQIAELQRDLQRIDGKIRWYQGFLREKKREAGVEAPEDDGQTVEKP